MSLSPSLSIQNNCNNEQWKQPDCDGKDERGSKTEEEPGANMRHRFP